MARLGRGQPHQPQFLRATTTVGAISGTAAGLGAAAGVLSVAVALTGTSGATGSASATLKTTTLIGAVSMRAAATPQSAFADLQWYSDTAALSSSSGSALANTDQTGAWVMSQVVATAPLNATRAALSAEYSTTSAAGEVHYADDAILAVVPAWSPGGVPSYGFEAGAYDPDFTSQFDRIWVVGGQQKGVQATYTLSPAGGAPAGTNTFPMPAPLDNIRGATVIVGGVTVAQPSNPVTSRVGVLGQDGSFDASGGTSNFVTTAVAGTTPPVLVLKTATTAGQVVTVSGQFRYPLLQIVNDPVLTATLGGLIFEKVLKDQRITDQAMAIQYGQQNIIAEGYSKKGGSLRCDVRGIGGVLVAPGQFITISSAKLFSGLLPGGVTTGSFLITGIDLNLQEDTANPYILTITFADRPASDDDDLFDHLIGETGRVNAALVQTDVNQIVSDITAVTSDTIGLTETVSPLVITLKAVTSENVGLVDSAPTASVPWGFVQATANSFGGIPGGNVSIGVTPPQNITTGNRLFAIVRTSGQAITGVTDTAANSWTQLLVAPVDASGSHMEVWTAPITAGGGTRPTVTATWASNVVRDDIILLEFSGLKAGATGLTDGTASAANTGTATPSSGSTGATTVNYELVLAIYSGATGSATTATPPTGFTSRQSVSEFGAVCLSVATADSGAAGAAFNAQYTLDAATNCAITTIVFKTA